jgi:hypothetical protein
LREYPIVVSTETGAAIRRTGVMREPGAAVAVDKETVGIAA